MNFYIFSSKKNFSIFLFFNSFFIFSFSSNTDLNNELFDIFNNINNYSLNCMNKKLDNFNSLVDSNQDINDFISLDIDEFNDENLDGMPLRLVDDEEIDLLIDREHKNNLEYLNNKLDKIKELIKNGADINSKNFKSYDYNGKKIGLSIIDYFSIMGNASVIDFIMKELDGIQTVDIDRAIFYAVNLFNNDVLNKILDYRDILDLLSIKDEDGNNLFAISAKNNSIKFYDFIDYIYNLKKDNSLNNEINKKIDSIIYNKNKDGQCVIDFVDINLLKNVVDQNMINRIKYVFNK